MKYFLIAGEASGDLHAAGLINALRAHDGEAVFYAYGGEQMEAAGARMLRYYRDIAYMGFLTVALHAGTILRAMSRCKHEIAAIRPDVVILVDYAGFNLNIARFVKRHTTIPVYYYIPPKVWAWKESRIRLLRAYVDEIFSILPFETDYYRRHGMEIHYVGNPTVDEVEDFQSRHLAETRENFAAASGLPADRAYIAILPGSRKQEIGYNLRRICQAARRLAAQGYLLLVACTPDIDESVYLSNIPEDMLRDGSVRLLTGRTYSILRYSRSAIVTSGTATLETALFRVPQVVCYYIPAGRMVSVLRKAMLKVRFISLVNLIAGEEVVRELVAGDMTPDNVRAEIEKITPDGEARSAMLRGYELVIDKLGAAGAPAIAAREIVGCLQRHIEQQSGVRDI